MSTFASFFPEGSSASMKNLRQISPAVQAHLKRVYFSLCLSLMASAIGVYFHLLWNIGGALTFIGLMGSIAFLLSTSPYSLDETKRVGVLMLAALCQGASLGPLMKFVIDVDPSILVTAFVATSLAFACFSAAAIVARRREYLYLQGLLSSGLTVLIWLQIASSIFGGSTAAFKFEIYFGLLIFLGYIVVDTQKVIEKAHYGDMDYVKHSLELFTDFVQVFVRLLIMLTKNSIEKSEKEKRKRRE